MQGIELRMMEWQTGMLANNMTNEQAPICSSCQTPMVLRVKGQDKFWGCPNWKDCGGKNVPASGYRDTGKKTFIKKEALNEIDQGDKMIEGMRNIYEKLDEILKAIKTEKTINM